ncbi:hypothetical protein WAX74_18545 [Psychrobacillus sp. FJAT-51614]|uniref:Uncharacterized protein n=1 Tax=Psychrobacillus mangrovi TaxID=3117745 RepID=A0ABU8FC43_9BACI
MKQTIEKVYKHLGIQETVFLEYPNLLLETYPLHVIIKEIESLVEKFNLKRTFNSVRSTPTKLLKGLKKKGYADEFMKHVN